MRNKVSAAAAALLTATIATFAWSGSAGAADLTVQEPQPVKACPQEVVILYDEDGHPTIPARTPYYYCVTGTTLLPGDIPPPPEYCCG